MLIKVYLLRSFGVDETGGNPAGVVLDSDYLTDKQKQLIAKKVGFSETAFIAKSDKADYKVSFFTPNEEVDLCGHATIAVYSLLFQNKQIQFGKYTQELKAGVLHVEIGGKGMVVMDQTLPVYDEKVGVQRLADIVGINVEAITSTQLIPQVAQRA